MYQNDYAWSLKGLFQKYDLSNAMAVIYRLKLFAFCRAESFTRWHDYYCCLYNNKRKKVEHAGCEIRAGFSDNRPYA